MENNSSFWDQAGFPASNMSDFFNQLSTFVNQQPQSVSLIFESGEEYLLITIYILILILGLVFNAAIIWVIVGK